jgi:diguanylate cyclase (GGDEF)-like protein
VSQQIPFYRSFRFRFVFLVVGVQFLFVLVAGIYFIRQQAEAETQKAFASNAGSLKVVSSFVRNGMNAFGENLNLLAVTSAMGSFDPEESGKLLKTYKVSSLFISGERVSLYDNNNKLVSDNIMVGGKKDTSGFNNFWDVEPLHIYMGPTRWAGFSPTRTFGVTVQNPARANGVLVADFSFRRLSSFLNDYRIGSKGFVVLVDGGGAILFHREPRWTKESVPVSQLGFRDFNAKQFKVKDPMFVTLSDSVEYMVNYLWDPGTRIGYLALQPRQEIEAMVSLVRNSMIVLFLSLLIIMTLLSAWISSLLSRPLLLLSEKMLLVKNGNWDVESGIHRTDEIGMLAEIFDTMRESIRKYILELGAHRDRLEIEVANRTDELNKANKVLQLMSRTDDLTGIPNRRDIMEKIRYETYRAQRNNRPIAFLLGDIDKFKSFNDTYGHDCGDGVLRTVAQAMRSMLRKHDYIARWGGEEFLVVLPETDLDGSHIVAERIRAKVESTEYQYGGKTLRVTITIGVAMFDYRLGVERSISLADRALYLGKDNGRNRVEYWDAGQTPQSEYDAAAQEVAINGGNEFDLPTDVLDKLESERQRIDQAENGDSESPRSDSVS